MISFLSPSNTSHLFPYQIIYINITYSIVNLTTFEENTTNRKNIYIYIQRQQLLKVYVTFHKYSYIYSSPSRLKFYLVVVLTYKGNNECQNLFSNEWLWIVYFGLGIHIMCYPTTVQTLTPNVRVQNHLLQKNSKFFLMLSKTIINVNIIIKFPHISQSICPCFIIAPTCTTVRGITLINNILCKIKLDHFINKYVFQTTLT
jgi:hypothetical protein